MSWLKYDGSDGIDIIFPSGNKRHKGDDTLVPFKTKGDKSEYIDFSGVVGAFSRILNETSIRKNLTMEEIKNSLRSRVETQNDDEFEKLFEIVKSLYFRNGKLVLSSAKTLAFIECNTTQRQVAEYLYSLFVDDTDIKEKYQKLEKTEDVNALERFVFEAFEDNQLEEMKGFVKAKCYLPYVREVFIEDFRVLLENIDFYKSNIQKLLSYYYMFYVTQLAIKLRKFEKADRNSLEKIFLTLSWEGISKVRPGYEYGWNSVLDSLSYMFSHSVVLQMISHNVEKKHYDYIGIYEKFNGSVDDEKVALEIQELNNRYKEWIPMDYGQCKYSEVRSSCKTFNEIYRLFETVDFQFINGSRRSHYNRYNKMFIEFVQKNFGKRRGTLGYTLGVDENYIIMFTQIILRANKGKIKLSFLYDEFERRGLLFDRESRKKIAELLEKMNLLEKRSDSGDTQYVKSIL